MPVHDYTMAPLDLTESHRTDMHVATAMIVAGIGILVYVAAGIGDVHDSDGYLGLTIAALAGAALCGFGWRARQRSQRSMAEPIVLQTDPWNAVVGPLSPSSTPVVIGVRPRGSDGRTAAQPLTVSPAEVVVPDAVLVKRGNAGAAADLADLGRTVAGRTSRLLTGRGGFRTWTWEHIESWSVTIVADGTTLGTHHQVLLRDGARFMIWCESVADNVLLLDALRSVGRLEIELLRQGPVGGVDVM